MAAGTPHRPSSVARARRVSLAVRRLLSVGGRRRRRWRRQQQERCARRVACKGHARVRPIHCTRGGDDESSGRSDGDEHPATRRSRARQPLASRSHASRLPSVKVRGLASASGDLRLLDARQRQRASVSRRLAGIETRCACARGSRQLPPPPLAAAARRRRSNQTRARLVVAVLIARSWRLSTRLARSRSRNADGDATAGGGRRATTTRLVVCRGPTASSILRLCCRAAAGCDDTRVVGMLDVVACLKFGCS